MSGWAPQDAADPSLRDDASVPSLRHPRPNRVCVLFAAPARRCPFWQLFPFSRTVPNHYKLCGNGPARIIFGREGVKTFSRSRKRENAKALCAIIHPISGYLLRPSSTYSFFYFCFFMFSLFSIERVFVFQLDQRRSATDRRFDRSTNRTQSKGGKVFPWVRQLEN